MLLVCVCVKERERVRSVPNESEVDFGTVVDTSSFLPRLQLYYKRSYRRLRREYCFGHHQ